MLLSKKNMNDNNYLPQEKRNNKKLNLRKAQRRKIQN